MKKQLTVGDETALMITSLLWLQIFQVLFLGLHDWVPLGHLNDLAAIRRVHGHQRMLIGTLISTTPFLFGLLASIYFLGSPFPLWLMNYLIVAYGILFIGEIESWWATYLFGYKASRAESYRAMFGSTHAFLPIRHGIVPNTLHLVLHSTTLATLVLLAVIRGST